MIMDSYLEIVVPLRWDEQWVNDVRHAFSRKAVRWQRRFHHITMAYMPDSIPSQQDVIQRIIARWLAHARPMMLTFDKLDAFTTGTGREHIIHVTSSQPHEQLEALTRNIRADLQQAGIQLSTSFKMHVTLGRVNVDRLTLDEIKHRLSSVQMSSFTIPLSTLSYIDQSTHHPIHQWHLR